MPVEVGIYQRLRDDAGVSAWVSGRIFGSRMPKNATLPAVVWTVVSTTDLGYSTQGASGLRVKRFQFDSYAKEYMDSVKLSDAIRSILQSYSGILPDGSSVNGCVVVSEMDFPYEPSASGYVQRHMLEVDVIYTELVLPFVPPGEIFPNLTELGDFDTIEDDGN
jgi:hypothetical protein